jgi:hypothetical protein
MTRAEVDGLRMGVETAKSQARSARREAADSDHWEWLSRERARLLRRWVGAPVDEKRGVKEAAVFRLGQCLMVLR